MHNQPWKEAYFSQPNISQVDHPKTVVKQAYYDSKKDVLVLTLLPGQKGVMNTSFAVNQLNQSKAYSIKKNGQLMGYLRKGVIAPAAGVKGMEFNREGTLRISTDLRVRAKISSHFCASPKQSPDFSNSIRKGALNLQVFEVRPA